MEVKPLLHSMTCKVPFCIGKLLLDQCDLPISNGWSRTASKIQEQLEEFRNNAHEKAKIIQKLADLEVLYREHIISGEKIVKLFTIEQQYASQLCEELSASKIEENPFTNDYPYLVDPEELITLGKMPKLLEVRRIDDNLALVFCSKRLITKAVRLDKQDLTRKARKRVGGIGKITAIKQLEEQAFDAIYIRPKAGIVEIRVDGSIQMREDDIESSFRLVSRAFVALCQTRGMSDFQLGRPRNLFSLIQRFYELESGNVHSYSFTTNEGGTRKEWMGNRKGDLNDLREESYHVAGKAAVEKINPFQITCLWETPLSNDLVSTYARISLQGKVSSLSESTPKLDSVIIERCGRLEDYETVFELIVTCLGNVTKQ